MKAGRQFSVKIDPDLSRAVDEWLRCNPDIKQATLAVMAIRKFVTEKQSLLPVKEEKKGKTKMARTWNLIIQETSPEKLRAWYVRPEGLFDTKSLVVQNENAPEDVLEHALFGTQDELMGSYAIENSSISTSLLQRVVDNSPNENLRGQASFVIEMRSRAAALTKSAG